MRIQKQTIYQMFLFGLTGLATLLIDVSITTATFTILHFPAYLASAVGFLSGFFFNFPMNRKKVFRHTEESRFSLRNQLILYGGLCVFNLVSTSIFVDLLVNSNILSIQYAKMAVTILIAIWNFLIFKFYIFSKEPTHS